MMKVCVRGSATRACSGNGYPSKSLVRRGLAAAVVAMR